MKDFQKLPPISIRRMVLATDLDGTFLGGSAEDRETLYQWIERNRASVGLVFVTGRDPAFIKDLCHSGVPWPEYVIGDVGTTIAQVHDFDLVPIAALEADIAATWDNAGDTVAAALADMSGLIRQNTEFRYRMSYDMDPDCYDPKSEDVVRGLGHDVLMSDNRYFDVLPKGVSKGPSLRRLVEHLNIPDARVLAAGDTLNDLSMLTCGLPAVAVGGSEPALLARVAALDHVHKARAIGAAGITEAINHNNMHPTQPGD